MSAKSQLSDDEYKGIITECFRLGEYRLFTRALGPIYQLYRRVAEL